MAYLVTLPKKSALGYARYNEALARGQYRLPHGALGCSSCALGQGDNTQILGLTIDPTLLLAGGIALLLAVYLFGGGRPRRKARRLRRRISRAQQQLQSLAV